MSANVLKILNQRGWDYKLSCRGVSIFAPTKQHATHLAQNYGYQLTETAAKIKGTIRICWKGCKEPIEFYDWMADGNETTVGDVAERILSSTGGVFCTQLSLLVPLLQRMIAGAENDRPVSIVRQDNRKQLMVNRPMASILQTPPEIATQRVITRFWLPEDLAELERRLSTQSQFTWTYSGGLNEQTWAILTTKFEVFEVEGIWYRQGICLAEPEIIPIPLGV